MNARIMRLKEVRKTFESFPVSMSAIARETGLKRSQVVHALKNQSDSPFSVVEKLSDFFDKWSIE